jgi:nitroreductase
MNDFLNLCLKRQSCRGFSEKPVEHEKLLNCVRAAALAHSACNSQPWSFIVAESPELCQVLAESSGVMGRNGFAKEAQAFFVVIEEHAVLMPAIRGLLDSQYFAPIDIGASVAYLCLEAADQGLGPCIMGIFDRVKIAEALNLPPEKRIKLIIAAGYPKTDELKPKNRKDINEISKFV